MSEVVIGAVDPSRGATERARLLIEAGRAKDALPLLQQAIAADPHDGESRCLLAYAYYQLREWRTALKAADEAAACDPHDEWSHRLRALALLALKQNGKALRAAQEASRLDPEGPFTLKTLSRCQLENGKRKDARKSAQRLREVAPEWSQSHETLGYVALVEQKWKEAEQHYREALKLDPESWSAMNDLGLCLQHQRRHKEAVELFHRAAQLNPAEAVTRRNLFGSVEGYLGGGAVVVYLAAQLVQHWAPLLNSLPEGYQPWLWAALGLIVVAAVAVPIWQRRRRLAEIDPTVLAFYRDEQRRARRRGWEQFAVVGSLGLGTGLCFMWWLGGPGLQRPSGLLVGLVAAATVAGFVCVARNWKQLSIRWDNE